MDRVNRRFLFYSMLTAVPMVLVMATLSTGTAPDAPSGEIQFALAYGEDDGPNAAGAVQPVVGKQIESRTTRPGLFQVLSGSKPSGSRNHRHQNMSSSRPKGLLEVLFDGSSSSSSGHTRTHNQRSANARSDGNTHRANNHNHRTAAAPQRTSRSGNDVNWDGIPYHRGDASRTSSREPIRDPSRQAVATNAGNGETRIIRGGARRSIQGRTVATRTQPAPTIARQPAPPTNIRRPRADAGPISTNTSSRRSIRGTTDASETSETMAATLSPAPAIVEQQQEEVETTLIPRVIRKKPTDEENNQEEAVAKRSRKQWES